MAGSLISPRLLSGKYAAVPGGIIVALLALPPLRQVLEANMLLHMLVQFPLLAGAGILIGSALPGGFRSRLMAWNHSGISGLLLAACITTFWMIPRALDEALTQPWIEALKFFSLTLGVGTALAVSWRAAGFLIQGFFIGNLLPMMAVAGWLYVESPVRLCNSYLVSQQEMTGTALILISIGAAIVWLASFFMQSGPGDKCLLADCSIKNI
ncbi:hypothetical protein MTYP_00497 [Methylophilaceae bacterium]|nr:hypothetical protein MTYP_00497 [Methylophilaceae bacterium]